MAISPMERASVSAISLRHNLATSGVTFVCRCHHPFASGGIWLRQESLRHIFASPGYAPATIAVNVTWMQRQFNACQTHRSMNQSIFNPFPVILSVSLTVHHFNTFLHILVLPWDNRVKFYMDRKRIKCSSNALQHACTHLSSTVSEI